jgi:hypothetical protein
MASDKYELPVAPLVSLTNPWAMLFPTMNQSLILTLSYISLRNTPLHYFQLHILTLIHHYITVIQQLTQENTYGERTQYPFAPLVYRFILVYDDTYIPPQRHSNQRNNGVSQSAHSTSNPGGGGYSQSNNDIILSATNFSAEIDKIVSKYLKPHQYLVLPQSLYTSPVLYYHGNIPYTKQFEYYGSVNTFFQNTALDYLYRVNYLVFSMALFLHCYLPNNPAISKLVEIVEESNSRDEMTNEKTKEKTNLIKPQLITPKVKMKGTIRNNSRRRIRILSRISPQIDLMGNKRLYFSMKNALNRDMAHTTTPLLNYILIFTILLRNYTKIY